MSSDKQRIGEMLIAEGVISEGQLENALEWQKEKGGHLGAILVKMGTVDSSVMAAYLSRQTTETIARFKKEFDAVKAQKSD